MASRRTLRSGASFGYNEEEPLKTKSSGVRRQQAKDDDHVVAPEQYTSYLDGDKSKECENLLRKEHFGRKHVLQFDEDKENTMENPVSVASCVSGQASVCELSCETTRSGGNAARSGAREKSDILVSLLGGKQISGDWSKYGATSVSSAVKTHEGEDDLDLVSRQVKDMTSVARGRALSVDLLHGGECPTASRSDVCFFSSSDPETSSSEILKMPELPKEAFLVSLSKDENKALNMVKTTLGTMRVSSSLHKLASQSYPFQESFSKQASHFTVKNKGQSGKWCSSVAKSKNDAREVCVLNPAENSLLQTPPDVVAVPLKCPADDSASRCSPSGSEACDSTPSSIENRGNVFENIKAEQSSYEPVSPTRIECVNAKVLSNQLHYTQGNFRPSVKDTPLKHQRVTQYPLMEEILTHQSYDPNMSRENHGLLDIPDAVDSFTRQPRKAISLLKSSAASMTPLSPVMEAGGRFDPRTFVKRSERLRCRTEARPNFPTETQRPVICTMKSASFKCKNRASSSAGTKKKKRVTPGAASNGNKKKKAKNRGDKKGGKWRDGPRPKHVMSREVMDGIVQSIEETISRVAQEHSQMLPDIDNTSKDMSAIGGASCRQESVSNTAEPTISSFLRPETPEDKPFTAELESTADERTKSCLDEVGSQPTGHIISKDRMSKKSKAKHRANKKFQKSMKVSLISKLSGVKKSNSKHGEPPELRNFCATEECPTGDSGDGFRSALGSSTPTTHSKRCRKKTRKAVEALGDDDVFLEEDWPTKKSKAKKR